MAISKVDGRTALCLEQEPSQVTWPEILYVGITQLVFPGALESLSFVNIQGES